MNEKEVEEIERMMSRVEKLSSISMEEWGVLYDRVYKLADEAEGKSATMSFLQKAKKELRKFQQHDIRDTERVREG